MGPKHCAASTLLALLAASAPAAAQLRDGLASNLDSTAGTLVLKHKALKPGVWVRAPDALQGAKIQVDGTHGFVGGTLRETLVLSNVRLSFGVGAGLMLGEGSRPTPLPGGLEARARRPWVALFDLAIGRQMRAGPVLPYLDLRVTYLAISSNVELRSPTEGLLNVSAYQAYLFDIGPRVGFWMPLGSSSHLDLSVRSGLFGPERFAFDLGFGFYLPFRRYG